MTATLRRSGRPSKLVPKDIAWAGKAWKKSVPVETIMLALDVSRSTLFRCAELHDFGPHPLAVHTYKPRTTSRRAEPTPSQWMCSCGGRCDQPTGHPGCAA